MFILLKLALCQVVFFEQLTQVQLVGMTFYVFLPAGNDLLCR
ncbi:hypothetical protein DFP94_102118 [Fontibacillus phaseoli]|uniref:Uncharacterized protein n=1 Tax=Fontibacillus phaseoli TaxID=1416533 RepID=A0A369BIG0_9BACL|nr:hypothetical protein DFP94_102118 [Fontibacillus phaseoli]